jgi:hypothetical protein
MSLRRWALGATIALAAALAGGSSAMANAVTPFTTVFNSDVAQFGYGGLRDNGTGTMEVAGVTGPVTQAFLYWHGPTNSDQTDANSVVSFGGQSVTGMNIGVGNNNCWGYANSQAYRADVTSLVSGNGSYALANFIKGSSVNANGASLIVFYDDGDPLNDKDVALFDGNDSNEAFGLSDPTGWDVTLPGIQYTTGGAAMVLHVADGQSFPDPSVIVNGTTLLSSGANFDGDTVPGNPAGDRSGLLWDIRALDVTSLLTPGANTLHMVTGPNVSDCLSMVVAEVVLPAGSAPAEAQLSLGDDAKVDEGDEGAKQVSFTVTRQDLQLTPVEQAQAAKAGESAIVSKKVTVRAATDGGTATAGEDYVAKSELLTFQPDETSKTFTVDVKGDTTVESDETIGIKLSGAVGGRIVKGAAQAVIANDDKAVVVPVDVIATGTTPKTCASRRNFTITLRTKRFKVRSAIVTVDGRKVAVRKGKRLTAPIDLRLKPRKTVVVRITVRTASGRTLTGTRVYKTCTKKRNDGRPPRL